MNKFNEWVRINHRIQKGVAEELGISQSCLHDILKKNQIPSLKTAYAIELYTQGDITVYDWIDSKEEAICPMSKAKASKKGKKIIK